MRRPCTRIAALLLAPLLASCGDAPSAPLPAVREMRVAPALGFCHGLLELGRCLSVSTPEGPLSLSPAAIAGFRHEEGIETDLLVLEQAIPEPLADGPDRRWILLREVASRRLVGVPRWADLARACEEPDAARDVPATAGDSITTAAPDADDALAALTRDVPGGFGGTFTWRALRIVRLVQPGSASQALPVLIDRGVIPATGVEVLRSRWSFAQLRDWRRLLQARLAGVPGIVGFAIDQTEGRVVIRWEAEAARVAIEQRARADALPCHLLALEDARMFAARP